MASPNSPVTYALTVGTVSIPAVGANPTRVKLEFFNTNLGSQHIIWVCPAQDINNNPIAAVAGAGSVPILAGGLYEVTAPEGNRISTAWNCISDTPAQGLTVIEYLKQAGA